MEAWFNLQTGLLAALVAVVVGMYRGLADIRERVRAVETKVDMMLAHTKMRRAAAAGD